MQYLFLILLVLRATPTLEEAQQGLQDFLDKIAKAGGDVKGVVPIKVDVPRDDVYGTNAVIKQFLVVKK
jgi:hypothetical protein